MKKKMKLFSYRENTESSRVMPNLTLPKKYKSGNETPHYFRALKFSR